MVNTNILDFWDLFVNEVFGSATLFMIVALIGIWYLSASVRLPNSITIMLSVIFILVMSFWAQNFLTIGIVLIAFIVGVNLIRSVNRG